MPSNCQRGYPWVQAGETYGTVLQDCTISFELVVLVGYCCLIDMEFSHICSNDFVDLFGLFDLWLVGFGL
jgi:hypothetical protein